MKPQRVEVGGHVFNLANIIRAEMICRQSSLEISKVIIWFLDGETFVLEASSARVFWEFYTRPGDCLNLMKRSANRSEIES